MDIFHTYDLALFYVHSCTLCVVAMCLDLLSLIVLTGDSLDIRKNVKLTS